MLAPEQLPIVQASTLSRARFFSDYVQASQPVLIRGALKNWPSKPNDWTNDFIRSLIGHKRYVIQNIDRTFMNYFDSFLIFAVFVF